MQSDQTIPINSISRVCVILDAKDPYTVPHARSPCCKKTMTPVTLEGSIGYRCNECKDTKKYCFLDVPQLVHIRYLRGKKSVCCGARIKVMAHKEDIIGHKDFPTALECDRKYFCYHCDSRLNI